ncbi:MAG: TIGR01777 family oxidoreductase [Actinobacteria bacterium]|nr:TIGR01777 family oxidoreductase [Actinomycetota bacterium]
MKTLITGGTGFIGKHLARELLSAGHKVVVLSRDKAKAVKELGNEIEIVVWRGTEGLPLNALQGVDCVVNLAGESIGSGRWTRAKKERIVASRVDTTRALTNSIKERTDKPKVFVSASAIGFYGPCGDEELTEGSPAGGDFLARVAKTWESEAYKTESPETRVATVRIGVVLGHGGALEQMIPPFRLCLGGPIGSGKQWVSWIHVNDLVGLIRFVMENDAVKGPVNATAPNPVRMEELCKALGQVMKRPAMLRTPEFLLRLIFGEMADLLLNGQRVLPRKALEMGYEFQFPTARSALEEVLLNWCQVPLN